MILGPAQSFKFEFPPKNSYIRWDLWNASCVKTALCSRYTTFKITKKSACSMTKC